MERNLDAESKSPLPFLPFHYGLNSDGVAILSAGGPSKPRHRNPPNVDDSVMSSIETPASGERVSSDGLPRALAPSDSAVATGSMIGDHPSSPDLRRRAAVVADTFAAEQPRDGPSDSTSKAMAGETTAPLAFSSAPKGAMSTQEVPLHITAVLCLLAFFLGYIL